MNFSPQVAALGGDGSSNLAIHTYNEMTIVSVKVGWSVVSKSTLDKARAETFVRPRSADEYDRAASCLADYGFTVLMNDRGTGRRSDALRLLAPPKVAEPMVVELSPDWEEHGPEVGMLPVVSGQRFLLDLSNESEEISEEFGKNLRGYGAQLKAKGSQLVVTVTAEVWSQCRDVCRRQTVTIPVRPPDTIIRAHLSYRLAGHKLDLLQEPALREVLTDLSHRRAGPQSAVDLAERLVDVDRTQLDAVVSSYRKWSDIIDKQLDRRAENWANRRMLMVAVAVLNGRPSTVVSEAYRLLANRFGYFEAPLYLALETEGWTTRMKEVGANVHEDRTYIDSGRPGLDLAIVEWLWREHPEARAGFLDWIESMSSAPLTRSYVGRIVQVLVHLGSVYRSSEIFDRAYHWARAKGMSQRHRLAEGVLSALLVDESAGRLAQRRLLQWAKGTSVAFPVIAKACGGGFGREFPSVAMVRLKHMAGRARGLEAQTAVASAFRSLLKIQHIRKSVLTRIVSWWRDSDKMARPAAMAGIEAALDPRPKDAVAGILLANSVEDPEMLKLLAEAWSLLAEHATGEDLVNITNSWSVLAEKGDFDFDQIVHIWIRPFQASFMSGQREFLSAMTDRMQAVVLKVALENMKSVPYRLTEAADAASASVVDGSAEQHGEEKE